MSLRDLKRILPPKPPQPKLCVACKAFRAECEVPIGEGATPMCWNCAHHVVDHDVPLHEAMTAECECTPDKVYPDRANAMAERQFQKALSFGPRCPQLLRRN